MPVKLSIPANAIRDDGSLVLSVARVEEAGENDRDDGVLLKHDHKEHNHEKHAKEEPDQEGLNEEELNEEVGKKFFWFESRRDRNGKPESGLQVVRDRIGFISNFVRTSLQAAALIPLLVALTTLAAALFSRPVAFAFVLTLFMCGSSMAFLIDVVDSLQLRSASLVFGGVAKPPTALDWALKHFLEFWILVLPDFDRMRGAAWLFSGDAIRWVTILHAQGLAALYTVVSLLPTSVFLRRWEVMR